MEIFNVYQSLYDYFQTNYGAVSVSLTTEMCSEGTASIEISLSGFAKLMNDLQQMKTLIESEGLPNSEDEIKYTFDEVMSFDSVNN